MKKFFVKLRPGVRTPGQKGDLIVQMYLCGHRSFDFVSQDGKKIQGTQLSVSYPAEDVTGELVDRIFVRRGIELPTEMVPGDVLDISFNNKGKPERITIVKQGK